MTSTCVCSEASINAVFRAAGSIDLCERIGLRVEQLVDIGQTLARSPDMARFASGVKPRRSKPSLRVDMEPSHLQPFRSAYTPAAQSPVTVGGARRIGALLLAPVGTAWAN